MTRVPESSAADSESLNPVTTQALGSPERLHLE